MRVCAKLHSAGIIHGDLLKARHFLEMPDGTLRICDFSTAGVHSCPGAHPLTLNISGDARPPESCEELTDIESWYGVNAERLGTALRLINSMFSDLPC